MCKALGWILSTEKKKKKRKKRNEMKGAKKPY
jgi:hypothetical protein